MFRTIVVQSKPRTPIEMVNALFERLKGPEAALVSYSSSAVPARPKEQTPSSHVMRRRRLKRPAIHTGTNIRSTWF